MRALLLGGVCVVSLAGPALAQPSPEELTKAIGMSLQDAIGREINLRVQLIRAEAKAAACSPGSPPPTEQKP